MKNDNELRIHIGGDYALTTYYPFFIKQMGLPGKRAMLYPLAQLKGLFEPSFTLINLECTLSLNHFKRTPKTDPPVHLVGYTSTINSLKYGNVNAVSLANNHSFDGGETGLARTIEMLKKEQMGFVGAGATLQEAFNPQIFEYHGYKIGVIAINTIYSHQNVDAPLTTVGKKVSVASLVTNDQGIKEHQTIIQNSIQRAKKNGADVVFVYYHWGKEYVHEVTSTQITLAKQAAEAGADFIVGTHQHVVQGIKYYQTTDKRTVPIAFGLGHLVFGAIQNPKELWSLVMEIVFERDSNNNLKLTRFAPLPIVTTPQANHQNAFQPVCMESLDKMRFLEEVKKRSEKINFS